MLIAGRAAAATVWLINIFPETALSTDSVLLLFLALDIVSSPEWSSR